MKWVSEGHLVTTFGGEYFNFGNNGMLNVTSNIIKSIKLLGLNSNHVSPGFLL